jgi:hypothetical protein
VPNVTKHMGHHAICPVCREQFRGEHTEPVGTCKACADSEAIHTAEREARRDVK